MKRERATSEIREVMDIRQAAHYLGISADTLYRYASEGFMPAFKLGNRWRFKRSRLDEWMDHQSNASLQQARSAAAAKDGGSPKDEVRGKAKPVESVRPPRAKRSREAER